MRFGYHLELIVCVVLLACVGCGPSARERAESELQSASLTFNKHIAPIVYDHCVSCHRPGQAGPFPLVTFEDVRQRADRILEVTRDRSMPPWLPDARPGHFLGERRLSDAQIVAFQRWVDQGMPEGEASHLPPLPEALPEWPMGQPDLVLTLPEAYTLDAEGPDHYRNFVFPVPIKGKRFIRALGLKPGNARIARHAYFLLDEEGRSRLEDQRQPGTGFNGIHLPHGAKAPAGFLLSWQPGRTSSLSRDNLAWPIQEGNDLVVQLYLRPSGKGETIQPEVGIYFASAQPADNPLKIGMNAYDIDIPAGDAAHVVEQEYEVPANMRLLALLPGARYVANELKIRAESPDGTTLDLLHIPRWDFQWQEEYVFADPIRLTKGTKVVMRYQYDNSTNNPANPHSPPQPVQYGLSAVDEIAEVWLQVLPQEESDRSVILKDLETRALNSAVAYNLHLLKNNKQDARAYANLGKALTYLKKYEEAGQYLITATQVDPTLVDAHYNLGLLYRILRDFGRSEASFKRVLQLNPRHARAHGNLGFIYMTHQRWPDARLHLSIAAELDPSDALAKKALQDLGNKGQ